MSLRYVSKFLIVTLSYIVIMLSGIVLNVVALSNSDVAFNPIWQKLSLFFKKIVKLYAFH